MAEKEVKINGTTERWQEWAVPGGKKEYDNLPSSLKPIIRSLARRPDELTPTTKLVEYYDDIEKLILDPASGIKDGDVAPYLARIAEKVKTKTKKERAAMRELPLHIGAVFEEGRNYMLVEHESIPILDIKNEDHRQVFILENLHAFNVLFKQPQSWKAAIDLWITDSKFAARAEGLTERDLESFNTQLKAMMAVTASARAMEVSAGSEVGYLVALTGGEKGNLSAQDTIADYLLHADFKKLNEVIENPLVKRYYDILMKDAGLINNKEHRWRKPENSDIELPSRVEFLKDSRKFRNKVREGRLVKYLKDYAEKGGLDAYIRKVLLSKDSEEFIKEREGKGFEKDARWAAARLACDAFLVDQWTRWESIIVDEEKKDKKSKKEKGEKKEADIPRNLSPTKDGWGGDPLKAIHKPSFLPRLKGVYMDGEESVILDLVDRAFRPTDIFKDELKDKIKVPSMVTNLKQFARLTEAISIFYGGSMAPKIASWDKNVLEGELDKMVELLYQVYGKTKADVKDEEGKDPDPNTGKHIVGAMAMRLLRVKALAAATESTKPGFSEHLKIIFSPQIETRPFLGLMKYLYGQDLDNKGGFIRRLVSEKLKLVIKGNKYGAEKEYEELYKILWTNDQTKNRNKAKMLNLLGLFSDAVLSAAESYGGRK